MRTRIETTNRKYGALEQGGVCGRIVSYDAAKIADIMRCEIAQAANMTGDEIVPGTDYCRLREYLAYHNVPGHVVRKGIRIQ
ncbi:MAG TPA: hypothetical protein PLL20_20015 [Phycisphaerae bacterium]|nr:hypothetical protein [Phycisphaerae bacterium]HRS13298.1 hypothetical protein [Sedimentisphaerales bacterium]